MYDDPACSCMIDALRPRFTHLCCEGRASRRTGHLRLPNEAESSSLALRLACSPIPRLRRKDCSILRSLGYMYEQAIYMVNSFQFTRSARLILASPTKGSVSADCPPSRSRFKGAVSTVVFEKIERRVGFCRCDTQFLLA